MPAWRCSICGTNFPQRHLMERGGTCPVCDATEAIFPCSSCEPHEDADALIAKAEFERRHGPADVDAYEKWLTEQEVAPA